MLLAIETATARGSVALVRAGEPLAQADLPGERDHGRTLAATVEGLLAGIPNGGGLAGLAEVDGYAVSIGPGSFTGLRVGLSFLKGVALAHPAPTVGVSTLEALASGAHRATGASRILAALDARGGEVFAAAFAVHDGDVRGCEDLREGLHRIETVRAIAGEWLAVGDGAPLLEGFEVADRNLFCPTASEIGRLAWPRFVAGEGVDPLDLEPAYHQVPAAVRNKPKSVRDPSVAR